MSIVLSGALKGAGDTAFRHDLHDHRLVGVAGPRLGPAAVGRRRHLGLWVWLAVYVCVLAVGFWWRWQQGHWETIRVIEGSTYIPPDTDDIR